MAASDEIRGYLRKAEENLAGAAAELAHGRYNVSASRCYYASFLAAIAALLDTGFSPRSRDAGWGHGFVQAEFAGHLIGRRKLYSSGYRDLLPRLLALRNRADYRSDDVSAVQVARALRDAESFVSAVRSQIGAL